MEQLSLHILRPNKYQSRYFGVDYFLDIAQGHNPVFKYLSTPLDPKSVYKDGPISLHKDMYLFLKQELSNKPKGSIIGIFANPDIYDAVDSLLPILELFDAFEMGLFLETSSERILNDINHLVTFAKKHPTLIAVSTSIGQIDTLLFSNRANTDHTLKIVQKLRQNNLFAGFLTKPFIPYINDDPSDFSDFLGKAADIDAAFVYPTFQINFDSKKIKEFYNVIDMEFPELMIKLHEQYGFKTSWESPNASELKKQFIIICRKNKILYAMKDIVNAYKPDINVQLKLF